MKDSIVKNYSSLNGEQLKQLLDDSDTEKEIRVWVEMKNEDGNTYLEGRRLVGVVDDPNDQYLCIVAGFYKEDSE